MNETDLAHKMTDRPSTTGMLMAPARIDRVASFNMPLASADLAVADATFTSLEKEGVAIIRKTGAEMTKARIRRRADMLYIGRGFEFTVTLEADFDRQGMLAALEAAHRNLFGRTPPVAATQFIALRVSVTAPMLGAVCKLRLDGQNTHAATLKGDRDVYFADLGEKRSTRVCERYALTPGTKITGTAVCQPSQHKKHRAMAAEARGEKG